jgi:gamma-glutamylcysteine synthetase
MDAVNRRTRRTRRSARKRDGEWVQLSTNILQIENEYYSTIRPKRVIRTGERPVQALCARGVQYIEMRCLDVDPFEPTGISLQTSRFLDVFLLYCAMADSTPSARALAAIRATGGSFNAFGLEQSRRHAAHFASRPLTAQETAWFDDLAATSLAEQVQMEQQPEGSFEGFVSAYRTSTLCRVST